MVKEHNPPHIHAICGDCVGMFSLSDGEMFEGDLGNKEQKLVQKFIEKYGKELLDMWETQQFKSLPSIEE